MSKPASRYTDEAKAFPDRQGVLCINCPKCEGLIQNVQITTIVKCPNCKFEAKVIE